MFCLIWFLLSIELVIQSQGACPPTGSVSSVVNDVHYWLPPNLMPFQEANELCQDNGMVLANVSTSAKINQVLQVASGSVGLWVGIYNPFDDWLTCQNQDCNFRLNTIYGLNLDYYNMNNPITIKKQFRCIELNPNSSMSSQDCQKLLQPVCETDCSPKDSCPNPNPKMYRLHGRWAFNYFINEAKTFSEIKSTCQAMNSKVVFVKERRDRWNPDWLARNEAGSSKEVYLGLDPSSLPRACTAKGWDDDCTGLKWLDGTPFERKIIDSGVETNGRTSVGCFVFKFNSSTNQGYIQGVTDCDVKRATTCISDCLHPRCPIPRSLKFGKHTWSYHFHAEQDQIRFVSNLNTMER